MRNNSQIHSNVVLQVSNCASTTEDILRFDQPHICKRANGCSICVQNGFTGKGERGKLPAWLKYLHDTTHKYMLNHFKCARAFEA